jgi:hypothetical protein
MRRAAPRQSRWRWFHRRSLALGIAGARSHCGRRRPVVRGQFGGGPRLRARPPPAPGRPVARDCHCDVSATTRCRREADSAAFGPQDATGRAPMHVRSESPYPDKGVRQTAQCVPVLLGEARGRNFAAREALRRVSWTDGFPNGNGSSNPPRAEATCSRCAGDSRNAVLGVFTVMEGVTRKPYSDSSATEGSLVACAANAHIALGPASLQRGRPGRQRRYRCRRRY